MAIGKRKGKVVKGAGAPGAAGSDNIGGSLSKNDHWYLQQGFGLVTEPGVGSGMVASGGVMTEYTSPPGAVYRCHTFIASGSFVVTSLGSDYNNLEYVVIAGGGGGGGDRGGGGGAGGYRSSVSGESTGGGGSLESALPAVVATYPVVIGAGGFGGKYSGPAPDANSVGSDGADTVLTHPTGTITSAGGGGAGAGSGDGPYGVPGRPGGSGGGATGATGQPDKTGGTGTANQGYAGANGPPSPFGGGGGGGAGSIGKTVAESPSMQGGSGIDSSITGYPVIRAAGGGGGGPGSSGNLLNGGSPSPIYPGGIGGPGGDTAGQNRGYDPGSTGYAANGVYTTGSGGGGSGNNGPSYVGGHGASGFVAIRYRMPAASVSAKATGGDISFYNGKVIHTFLTSGTFVTPGSFSETCEYVVIGGGGGTAHTNGGGGAGLYRTGTMPIGNSVTSPVTIGYGGNGQPKANYATAPTGLRGFTGGTTTFAHPTAPIASGGGGYGSGGAPPNPWSPGGPGGSGGGGSDWAGGARPGGTATGVSFPGTIGATPPTNGWGFNGGQGSGADAGGGGGGGAGSLGLRATEPPSPQYYGGQGGLGIQLPTTFRSADIGVGYPGPTSPTVTGADDSGLYYVAGGGGGGGYSGGPYTTLKGGGGGGRPNPTTDGSNAWAGSGAGGYSPTTPANAPGNNGQAGSGSGGGAGVTPNGPATIGGNGGSGIVLIAYPQ